MKALFVQTLLATLGSCIFAVAGLGTNAVAQGSAEVSRQVSARVIPVPSTVSPQMQKVMAAPPDVIMAPKTTAEWKALIGARAKMDLAGIDSLEKDRKSVV